MAMGYVTHIQLADRPGALELAQVASNEDAPVVDTGLMNATLRGGDRSAWPLDQLSLADAALARIEDAVRDADGRIDGFLMRGGYNVPLAPVPSIVASWSRDIARYLLHKDRIRDEREDPIARAYRDAMSLLEQTAKGTFRLGIDDPKAPTPGAGDPTFVSDDAVWNRKTLEDFL